MSKNQEMEINILVVLGVEIALVSIIVSTKIIKNSLEKAQFYF